MRGLTLLLTVAAGVALLAACDGSSGTGFQTGATTPASVDAVLITSPTQEVGGIFPLSLQASTAIAKQVPLTLDAEGIHSPGASQVALVGTLFTWTASFATCGGRPSSSPTITLDYIDPHNTNPDPNHSGYSILLSTDQKSEIALFPPIVTPAPGSTSTPSVDYPVGFPIPTAAPSATPTAAPAASSAQYCVVVAAHAADGKVVGANVTVSYP